MLLEPFKITAPSRTAVDYLETNLSAAFYLHHTDVGKSALNQLGICFQLRNETFKAQNNVILCRQWHYEPSAILATAQRTLRDIGNDSLNPACVYL